MARRGRGRQTRYFGTLRVGSRRRRNAARARATRATAGSTCRPPTTLQGMSVRVASARKAARTKGQDDDGPSVMLRHAKYSTATAAVSSTVATKVPSTLCAAPCAARARSADVKVRHGRLAHLADDLAQQEKVELAQDEEHRGEDEVPHRADLVEHGEHDVGHDRKVEDRSAAQGACERADAGRCKSERA